MFSTLEHVDMTALCNNSIDLLLIKLILILGEH